VTRCRAELETATCMAFPYVLGQRDPADIESFIATVLVNGALRRRTRTAPRCCGCS